MNRIALHDGWTLRLVDGPIPTGIPASIPAAVPGTVHTDLLSAGLIPDPYLDLNEAEVQWIGQTDVEYDVSFDFLRGEHERVDLVCDGLDTVASIELNGVELGTTCNQHRSYRFDLREALRDRDNELTVGFRSALDYAYEAEERLGKRPAVGNAYPYNAIRKMACNFGWDWGPVLITAGIWKPISIEAWSTARLASVRPVVSVDPGAGGTVRLHVELERTDERMLTVNARILDPRGREVDVARRKFTADSTVLELTVEHPELWWPRGYGDQPLYEIVVELGAGDQELARWSRNVGFRTVEVSITPDDIGTSFSFHVNGQYVYVKGANWIPEDCFLPRVTPERYVRSIADATDAGMNMLRVWGGGIYESDTFYDTCDREGLLVWQDFALACAAYSEAPELWNELEAEARENVTRLAPHPSLVIWNGGNENVEGFYHWGWQEKLEGETWGNGYYERLLPGILAELDPTRAYIPSSPFNPRDPTTPRDADNGPVHEWEVWNRQDYGYYRENIPRFVAEFGFQGPPAFSTIERTMHDQPLARDSPAMLSHQKAEEGSDKLQWGLGAHLPHPVGFDDWHFATQLNQARAISYGIEHFRSHSPRTAGSVIWQLNDCWPVASWAAVDGDKRRKPLWYALRSVNAARLLTIQPRDGALALVVSNDSATAWTEVIEVRRVGFDGALRTEQAIAVNVAPRTNATISLEAELVAADDPKGELIVATSTSARRAFWYFTEDPELRIPALDVDTRVARVPGGYAVDIAANAFVKDLVLLVDRLDPAASVDEMFITLLPGETKTVTVQTGATIDVDSLTRHPVLQSVNDLLSLSGANRLASP